MRCEIFMESRGYYVATHILMVWKRLACLAPDQPHSWSFPDEGCNRHQWPSRIFEVE
jgi:hypothetical protein